MVPPPLASLDALTDRLARPLTNTQRGRAAALLIDISTEVRAATGRAWTLPDGTLNPARPDVLAVVTLRAAERAMRNPAGLAAETVGDYTRRFGDGDEQGGAYLTEGERRMVAATVGAAGLVSVPTVRDVVVDRRRWIAEASGGDPILWSD
jgi:hypothetical protein